MKGKWGKKRYKRGEKTATIESLKQTASLTEKKREKKNIPSQEREKIMLGACRFQKEQMRQGGLDEKLEWSVAFDAADGFMDGLCLKIEVW